MRCTTSLRARLTCKVSGQPWFLAIDLGTGGPKTGAVSLNGDLLGQNLGSVQTRYLHDPSGNLVARIDVGTGLRQVFTDQHGSVRDITDTTGTVLDPFRLSVR